MPDKFRLDNGSTILIDSISHSKTVSIGFWIGVGSRDESTHQHGLSHLIEHMLFKGTAKRNYLDIAMEVDELGGEMNGATAKEFTYYYINIAKEYFENAVDILTDMYFNPAFNKNEFKKEKGVILDELDSIVDDPEEFINDFFSTTLWGESSFGYPVIGIRKDIKKSSVESLKNFYQNHYNPEHLIISVSGGLDVKDVLSIIKRFTGKYRFAKETETNRRKPEAIFRRKFQDRKIEQVYLIAGRDAYSYLEKGRYPMILLNSIIGGSFSSILFQEIREKMGLSYSISSSYLTYSDIGEFSIGFSTSTKNVNLVLNSINSIITDIKKRGIDKKDLERAKKKFYGNYALASESNEWLMSRMAMNEMVFGRIIPYQEVMSEIEKIKIDEIYQTTDDIFKSERFSIATIGPEDSRVTLKDFRFTF